MARGDVTARGWDVVQRHARRYLGELINSKLLLEARQPGKG
jgi:hypothetical protein